jgi:hypothetical protein
MITPHAQLYKEMESCFDVVASDPQRLLWRGVRCVVELLV